MTSSVFSMRFQIREKFILTYESLYLHRIVKYQARNLCLTTIIKCLQHQPDGVLGLQ